METFRSPESNETEFRFAAEDRESGEVTPNLESYRGCLVHAMQAANGGSAVAHEVVETTIIETRGNDFAMACGKCGITMVRDGGVVYGASRCPLVGSGQIALGELA
jgi:hypothetical protein